MIGVSMMVMLEDVRINALDYRTCGITTFSIHVISREGGGFLSIGCACFRFHCCPLTKLTSHCEQHILQGKTTALLLNGRH